jgi:hypothetical protein
LVWLRHGVCVDSLKTSQRMNAFFHKRGVISKALEIWRLTTSQCQLISVQYWMGWSQCWMSWSQFEFTQTWAHLNIYFGSIFLYPKISNLF